MNFWLIVYLFTTEGEFMAKDIYETASEQQCVEFAGQVAQTVINTQLQAQFYCLSDDEYRQSIGVEE
jgi:hypothetical protein